jgi:hypothetical protein
VRVVAAHALRESLRRRVFLVVLVLSVLFLGLYAWGAAELLDDVDGVAREAAVIGIDAEALIGANVLGLAMFTILFLGAVVLATIALFGSVLLPVTANGIAVFMIFGAGLTAGLLGQIGEALNSETLDRISDVGSWALPFEALYQHGLSQLTADAEGVTQTVVQLGPFGGAQEASFLVWPFAVVYVAAVFAAAT